MALLPDPDPRQRQHVLISVDDHVIEPPDMFDGRLPTALADRAPRVVETDDGRQVWRYEDREYPNIGLNAVIGRPREEWSMDAARFDEMRRGCWDIDARIADMDLAGIWASLNFPSLIAGFAGTVFWKSDDPELGLAALRAWNDWHLEAWAGAYPDRIIPLQLPWLADPQLAPEEIRRNAARGFKAVSFPELPAQCGIPSLHSGVWDPFFAACEETDTVVCLHTGSAQWAPIPAPDTPFETITTLFPVNGLVACADMLWSGIPVRFPRLNITLGRGRAGLGGHARRPRRLRSGALRFGPRGRGVEGRPAAQRGAAAQLLVLLDRRPARIRRAGRDRCRPHPRRERLPARRLHLAGHPTGRGAQRRRPVGGGRGPDHPPQRGARCSATRCRTTGGWPPRRRP